MLAVVAVMALCSCGTQKRDTELEAKVAEFETTCDKVIELDTQVQDGDLSVTPDFVEAARQMQKQAEELAARATELTPEQAERMEAAAGKAEAAVLD